MGLQSRNPFDRGELDDLLAEDPDDLPIEDRHAEDDPDDDEGGLIDLRQIHHIGIAVADLDEALDDYRELFGAVVIDRAVLHGEGVEAALVEAGGSTLLLLAAVADDAWIVEFLDGERSGLTHAGFLVEDLAEAARRLAARGWVLIDAEAQDGLGGRRTMYVHPPEQPGTLMQLVAEP